MTSTDVNRVLFNRYINELLNRHDLGALKRHAAPELVAYLPNGEKAGFQSLEDISRAMLTAFPDLRVTVDETVVEADKVVALLTMEGTHTGPFRGHPPTGKRVKFAARPMYRFRDGRITEFRPFIDELSLLRQLGVLQGP